MTQPTTTQAYRTTFKELSEMKAFVGKELGLTDWVPIRQKRINQFAEATEDHQWIHTDPERSEAESPYGKPIAHGFLVLSLASYMCASCFRIENAVMGINYGLDKVRFPNATTVDSMIRGRVSLMTYDAIPRGAKYKLKVVFEVQGADKPACVAEFIGLCYV